MDHSDSLIGRTPMTREERKRDRRPMDVIDGELRPLIYIDGIAFLADPKPQVVSAFVVRL